MADRLSPAEIKLLARAWCAKNGHLDHPVVRGAQVGTLRRLQRRGYMLADRVRIAVVTPVGIAAYEAATVECCGEFGTGSGVHGDECPVTAQPSCPLPSKKDA